MTVLIVGGGKTGSSLAEMLLAQEHEVLVVELRPDRAESLKADLPAESVLQGDGADPGVLVGAGVEKADVVAAVTGDDEDNLVISTLARFEFGVPRVVARVNHPKNAWLFTSAMGVDVAIDEADLIATLIAEEMSLGQMMTLLKLRKGAYSIVEEKIEPASTAVGRAVKDLALPRQCTLVGLIREGALLLPKGDTVIEADDEVLAIAHESALDDLAAILAGPSSRGGIDRQ